MSPDEYHDHCNNDDGFCKTCDAVTRFGSTEPDAREYPCEVCGERSVYGMEEAMLMGLIEMEE
jgi:hypothetical protein